MEISKATKTKDEDIKRWNNQPERERQYWLTIAHSSRPIDAWRAFKFFKNTEVEPNSWRL